MTIEKRKNSYRITVSLGYGEDGKQIRERYTYNPDPTLTKKQAYQAAYKYGIELENKLKRGGSVKYDKLSFNQFAEMYFNTHAATLKEYTATQYWDIYEKRLKSYFGNMKVKKITVLDITDWLASLKKTDGSGELSDNSKGVYFRTLKAMLSVAERLGIIDSNPCKKIPVPSNKKTRVKALQQPDVNTLFDKIDSYPDSVKPSLRFAASSSVMLVYLLVMTGIREGEAAGLKWTDIDYDNRLIHIEREIVYIPKKGVRITPPKSDNSIRDVFIPELLCTKLKEYKAIQDEEIKKRGDLYNNNDFIFAQFDGSPVHGSSIRKSIKRAFAYCDVPYVTVHGLRHTYASLSIANGTDPRTAAAQLGHSTPSITMNVYANPQNEAKRRAADLMESIVKKPTNK